MEAEINYSVSKSNVSSGDIFSEVPLFATYLKLLLVAVLTIVIPASLIIHVIWKNRALHKKYYFFVVNLMVADTLSTPRYLYEMLTMMLYLLGITIEHSEILIFIMAIPRINLRFAFLLLAIDRVIGVGFPYHYRKIMTHRVVCVLICASWCIAAIVSFITWSTSTLQLVQPFGSYVPPPSPIASIVIGFSLFSSIILIVATNAYLYYVTFQSNKKL
ncbi:melanocortin receptor 4-like [Dysidea avara]|uniref:melanocortin receptor 4-like n=1 Tax=Dysidea avara TaxID=196820 RepID=UPI00331F0EBE